MKYEEKKIKEQLVDDIRTLVAFQIEYDHAEKLADWIISDRKYSSSQALDVEWPRKIKHSGCCGGKINHCICGAEEANAMHDKFMAKIKNVRGK